MITWPTLSPAPPQSRELMNNVMKWDAMWSYITELLELTVRCQVPAHKLWVACQCDHQSEPRTAPHVTFSHYSANSVTARHVTLMWSRDQGAGVTWCYKSDYPHWGGQLAITTHMWWETQHAQHGPAPPPPITSRNILHVQSSNQSEPFIACHVTRAPPIAAAVGSRWKAS